MPASAAARATFTSGTAPAGLEPGEVLEQRLGLQPSAELRQARDKPAFKVGPVQARPLCCSRFFGRALIQSVMVPAPRPTTRSPDLATEAMVSSRVSSSS